MNASSSYTDLFLSGFTPSLAELMPRGEAVRNLRSGVYVLLVAAGEARIQIDGNAYRLLPEQIVLLFPYHTMSSQSQSADFRFRYLYFDFDFMSDFPLLIPPAESERFGTNPCYQAEMADFAVLNRCYDTLLEYNAMPEHPSRGGMVKAQLFIFVSELLRRCADHPSRVQVRRGERLTADFFQLLHRHYKTQRSLGFYAGRLCVTTKYLSKVIRNATGQTVCFWIEEFVVKEAKLLLRTTQATVTEIAEQLNFPNSSFFAKFFRRHAGCSPGEFRAEGKLKTPQV